MNNGTQKVKTREVIQQAPRAEIKGCDYALFPTWFLTLRINNQPYMVLINGQTGMVFSALPTDYGKMNKGRWLKRLTIMPAVFVASMLVTWLGVSMVPKDGVPPVIVVTIVFFLLTAEILGGAILWAMASINYREYQRNTALTISQQNNRYGGERQGRV